MMATLISSKDLAPIHISTNNEGSNGGFVVKEGNPEVLHIDVFLQHGNYAAIVKLFHMLDYQY